MAQQDQPVPVLVGAVADAAADHTLLAVMHERQLEMDKKVDSILEQTLKTNGRVTGLESFRDKAKGAYIALSIFGPLLTGLVVGFILKH